MTPFKGERFERKTATKEIFHYHDTENGIKQISKELDLEFDIVTHYPIGYEGGPRYNSIQKITFANFRGKLPIGVNKVVAKGYTFTRPMSAFASYLDNYGIVEVYLQKEGGTFLDDSTKVMHFNETDWLNLVRTFATLKTKHLGEIDFVLKSKLHTFFPDQIKKAAKTYFPNALAFAISTWGNSIDEFSDTDKEAINDLFDKLSVTTNFLSSASLAKTKEIIDSKYIQAALTEFKRLMKLTIGTTLEKKWQKFLEDNSWIFSTIFAQPIILHQREAYVGGKKKDNSNGKLNDFLVQNSLSNNVSFIELKTHKTDILEAKPYRGNDVFAISKELSGSISQVLNQRDNFQKEFYAHKVKNPESVFESFNSKCFILIGTFNSLSREQKAAFELIRSNSRDVEIITFDELLTKIEALQKML